MPATDPRIKSGDGHDEAEALQVGTSTGRHERAIKPYLENFLYFSRCGMIESVPRRRILSAS